MTPTSQVAPLGSLLTSFDVAAWPGWSLGSRPLAISGESSVIREELLVHADELIGQIASRCSRVHAVESGGTLRLAANVLRRGGVAGVALGSRPLAISGGSSVIREELLVYADELTGQLASRCSRVYADESGGTLRLAANVLRRGGVAGVALDSRPLAISGESSVIREELLIHADELTGQIASRCSRVHADESGGTLRLAANVLRRGGVAGVALDSRPLAISGDSSEIREKLLGYADEPIGQISSRRSRVSSDESGGTFRLAASVLRRGGVAMASLDSEPLALPQEIPPRSARSSVATQMSRLSRSLLAARE